MRQKKNNKLVRPLPEIAQVSADSLIARYSIKDAERIAKLVYEKIIANRKSLDRRHKE